MPIGLTIYSQIGRQIGVATPIMDSVITISGALLSRDFAAEGRTLQRCGIVGMGAPELRRYVQTGHR